MRRIKVEKVTLNIGVGVGGKDLSNAEMILREISDQNPVRTYAKRTNKDFGIRQGAPIGCKVTIRGEKAVSTLEKLFEAKGSELPESSFNEGGNFSFGIKEHIEIPKIEYDPDVGIYGMDVCVSLARPGYRIKNRRIRPRSIPPSIRIDKEEAINFVKQKFGVQVK
ncbi:50S ribosomal protein L5 [candidate division MSBL1 archaeon SCGC-AAA261F19]|uniref:Large ribosomal subunit protein uL5 n=2 Tax=candidate division MSBL1 TaxID=215777 RepID=A0A133VBL0_9EURY|nr:50S ribosomal protein L5 [candidate division MSBL1 archaeon SCGC-AAA261D19]KXB03797.1 50S ribosomal protein L5 [candidate division MSBL1 archaeon SCGC-AAA261F19]